MSWQYGQMFERMNGQLGGKPLAAMTAAVMAAAQKPVWEQGLVALQDALKQVPADVDWVAFQQGVARYTTTPKPAPRDSYPTLLAEGRVRLLDAGGVGAPVVLVPSMVNRGYILDLYPGASLVAYLRGKGHRVLLVDWGDPVAGDGPLDLETVIAGRLEPLLRAAAEVMGPVKVFGYCMGGLLALAAAVRLGETVVSKLAVAAMPWDFEPILSSKSMAMARTMLEPWLAGQQVIPPDMMAQYFWLQDPWGPVRRIMAYGREVDPDRVAFMTALEDWLADGLALDAPVAKEMMLGWHADNAPFAGTWQVQGVTITPGALEIPFFVCLTENDVLVPLASSLAVVGQARSVNVVRAGTGHVGLVCGRKAEQVLYKPLDMFLR